VFQAFAGVLDEADEALDRAALFLAQHIRSRREQNGELAERGRGRAPAARFLRGPVGTVPFAGRFVDALEHSFRELKIAARIE
jgi:hypothetical protein